MRKNIVAGNWKMNLNRSEGLGLVEDVLSKLPVDNITHVILAPSFVYLHKVAKMCTDIPKVVAASQDCSANEKGAFTGEVSASMIASCSARYVVLGHSERRTNFTETNELLKTKVGQVFANDLKEIFPKKYWNKLHLQIIWYGREYCKARDCYGMTCKICKSCYPNRKKPIKTKKA